jgi:hypothetical protein
LEVLVGKYECINIKLDKTGGLTEVGRLCEFADLDSAGFYPLSTLRAFPDGPSAFNTKMRRGSFCMSRAGAFTMTSVSLEGTFTSMTKRE